MPAISSGLALGLGLAGGIGSAAIGASAAGHAADTQSQAAMYAANLQKQEADQALAFQKQVYGTQQQQAAPWLKAGQGAITKLSSLLSGGGFPDWNQQFQ